MIVCTLYFLLCTILIFSEAFVCNLTSLYLSQLNLAWLQFSFHNLNLHNFTYFQFNSPIFTPLHATSNFILTWLDITSPDLTSHMQPEFPKLHATLLNVTWLYANSPGQTVANLTCLKIKPNLTSANPARGDVPHPNVTSRDWTFLQIPLLNGIGRNLSRQRNVMWRSCTGLNALPSITLLYLTVLYLDPLPWPFCLQPDPQPLTHNL